VYCTICGNTAVATCSQCGRHVCRGHRRWLLVTLCSKCFFQVFPGCLTLTVLVLGGVLLWRFVF
jgi:hypothetical protein